MNLPTSSAWLGPDRTDTSACGISSLMMSHNVIRVFSSIPLATFTIFCPGFTKLFMLRAVFLVNGEGTASMHTSGLSRHPSISDVIVMSSGITTPGSFDSCCLFSLSMATSSSIHDQMVTLCPFFSSRTARAVPQLPAPIMLISAIKHHLLLSSLISYSPYPYFPCEPIDILFSVPFSSLTIFFLCRKYASAVISTNRI